MKRYSIKTFEHKDRCKPIEDTAGEFIKYKDVAAIIKEKDKRIAFLERSIHTLLYKSN